MGNLEYKYEPEIGANLQFRFTQSSKRTGVTIEPRGRCENEMLLKLFAMKFMANFIPAFAKTSAQTLSIFIENLIGIDICELYLSLKSRSVRSSQIRKVKLPSVLIWSMNIFNEKFPPWYSTSINSWTFTVCRFDSQTGNESLRI